MRFITAIAVFGALIFLQAPSHAQTEDLFDRLSKERVTVLDNGIKRLRGLVRETAKVLKKPSGQETEHNVAFDKRRQILEAKFFVQFPKGPVTDAVCWDVRAKALGHMFLLTRGRNATVLTPPARVHWRLGSMFTIEPPATSNLVIATGQRLAELTFLEVTLSVDKGGDQVVCRARIDQFNKP